MKSVGREGEERIGNLGQTNNSITTSAIGAPLTPLLELVGHHGAPRSRSKNYRLKTIYHVFDTFSEGGESTESTFEHSYQTVRQKTDTNIPARVDPPVGNQQV